MNLVPSLSFDSCLKWFNPFAAQPAELTISPATIDVFNDLSMEPQAWIEGLCQRYRELEPGQLMDFFSLDLPQFIASYDLDELKRSCQVLNVGEHAFQKEQEIPISSADLLFNSQTVNPDSPGALRFLYNFIENLISALNFFEPKDPPSSVYEQQAVIQIYYHFLKIPFAIALILQPLLIITWKVYLATLAVLSGLGLGLYVYKRWIRPFPKDIPCGQEIGEIAAKNFSRPIQGLEEEVIELSLKLNFKPQGEHSGAALIRKRPVMIIAPTGEGKTTLLYKLHQKIQKGEVHSGLKDKKLVLVKGSDIVVKSNLSFGDKIREIRAKLKGFEKEAIVCIDEVQAVAKNPACLASLKDFLRVPDIQFVTITTPEAFQDVIQELDKDRSFRRTFQYMTLGKWRKESVKSLLEEVVYHEAKDVLFEGEAIDKIIELAQEGDSKRHNPDRVLKLLELVISTSRTNFEDLPGGELTAKKEKLKDLKHEWIRHYPAPTSDEDKERGRLLAEEIHLLKQTRAHNETQGRQLQKLIQLKNRIKEDSLQSCLKLAQSYQEEKEENIFLQKEYLLTVFYLIPALDKMIEEQVQSIGEAMDVIVNANFVEKVFRKYQSFERNLQEDVRL